MNFGFLKKTTGIVPLIFIGTLISAAESEKRTPGKFSSEYAEIDHLFETLALQGQYDDLYHALTARIRKNNNMYARKLRFNLFLSFFKQDQQKQPMAKEDCMELLVQMVLPDDNNTIIFNCLNYLHKFAINRDMYVVEAILNCANNAKQPPLKHFIANCFAQDVLGKLAQRYPRQFSDWETKRQALHVVAPPLAEKIFPQIQQLSSSIQEKISALFITNYLDNLGNQIITRKTAPESPTLIQHCATLIKFSNVLFTKDQNDFYSNYCIRGLGRIYEYSSSQKTIAPFLLPLLELFENKIQNKTCILSPQCESYCWQLLGLCHFHSPSQQSLKKIGEYLAQGIQKDTNVLLEAKYVLGHICLRDKGFMKYKDSAKEIFVELAGCMQTHPSFFTQPNADYYYSICTRACLELGRLEFQDTSYDKAFIYFTLACTYMHQLEEKYPDHPESMVLSQSCLMELAATNLKRNDFSRAYTYFIAATQQPTHRKDLIAYGWLQLAHLHEQGKGIARSQEMADTCAEKAAALSDPEMQRQALEFLLIHEDGAKKVFRLGADKKTYQVAAPQFPKRVLVPSLSNSGTIPFPGALLRLAELNLHAKKRAPQRLADAQIQFSRARQFLCDDQQLSDTNPAQPTQYEQMRIASSLGLAETYFKQQRFADSEMYYWAVAAQENNAPLRAYAWLRLGDLHKENRMPTSSHAQAKEYYTKAAQQTDHLPTKKTAEERLKKFASK